MKIGRVNTKSIFKGDLRFDPDIHLSEGVQVRRTIDKSPYPISTVGENADSVFYGNIFSRIFVKKPEFGVEYLQASDTVLADLHTGKYLSKIQADKLSYLRLKKDWIVVTCSGTLGNVTYTTKCFEDKIATHDLIRIVPNDNKIKRGCMYAFLSGKFGYHQITQSQFGGVVKHINDIQTKAIKIPVFPEDFQEKVDALIQDSARLREEATEELEKAKRILKESAGLPDLTPDDYDYYGPRSNKRQVSCFTVNKKNISSLTINAFNHSERIKNLKKKISGKTITLRDAIRGGFFSTGSFPRVEVKQGKGIMLINQSDIFDNIIKGKSISKRNVRTDNLVNYGEVLIAGVGTLGENETFCRCIFANEDLEGQLVSGEFIRMKTTEDIPSGYLYLWLNSDYGFRLIRFTQTGTKLCRPIQRLLLEQPVPVLDKSVMMEIDKIVKSAHTKKYQANQKETQAISLVEAEIEKWDS